MKVFGWYIDLIGIKSKNILKYPYPTDIKICKIRIKDTRLERAARMEIKVLDQSTSSPLTSRNSATWVSSIRFPRRPCKREKPYMAWGCMRVLSPLPEFMLWCLDTTTPGCLTPVLLPPVFPGWSFPPIAQCLLLQTSQLPKAGIKSCHSWCQSTFAKWLKMSFCDPLSSNIRAIDTGPNTCFVINVYEWSGYNMNNSKQSAEIESL